MHRKEVPLRDGGGGALPDRREPPSGPRLKLQAADSRLFVKGAVAARRLAYHPAIARQAR